MRLLDTLAHTARPLRAVAAAAALVATTVAPTAQAAVVLIQSGAGVMLTTDLNAYFNSLSGVTSSVIGDAAPLSAAALAGVDLFIGEAMASTDSYSAGELSALTAYVTGGGTAFLAAENNGFAAAIAAVNAAAANMGSTMSVSAAQIEGGCGLVTASGAQLAGSLMAGVSSFSWGCGSRVNGGTTELFASNLSDRVIASQAIGAGHLVIAGDSNLANNGIAAGNRTFFANLLNMGSTHTVPEPGTLLLVALSGLGMLASSRRRAG
ncbi:exported hypothetical protein [Rubrivivax sp. A210]|uniref:PEP-CTERM sorting domain-containing protein n=1 Tax=Rubrivivax sp. A210 TaxID=2772301 RepID=UPI0019185903|nr:PEP-CTERM sorting domain-containing protein [Rubrivivax sp. A210]CAD5373422.1 exported hypothetical protein [Rubrivivax sp. A210]